MSEANRFHILDRVKIYPRGKKNIYCADFWSNGQHRRVSLKTPNMKIARQRAAKIEADLASGHYSTASPAVEISQAVEKYLNFLESEGRARKTIVRYRGELNTFSDFCLKHRKRYLSKIDMLLFDDYRSDRRQIHEKSTVYHESVVVKQFLKWCQQRKLINDNPLTEYKLVKPRRASKPSMSLQNVLSILEHATETYRLQFAMLAFTGIRSGELRHLRQKDVDFEGNWVHIVSRPGAETKTRESRKVPLHPRLKQLLLSRPHHEHEWFFTADPSKRYPDGGHWISTKRLNESLLRILKKLKLPRGREDNGFTVHSLRHFFKTHCVNELVPKPVVDIWQGHQIDMSVGAQYYNLADEVSQRFMSTVNFDLNDKED
ncbi:tyrosine-type recombinase/integrase [Calycomorphotria hydatis]|uniref:tyrosine-type recombinase/integrase n=1 Tax=Calycomorphotria hydatis TaxID=2528027 RepID=UPI0018D232AE|nr:tyrosine-type recombinase/integrase [Calycomorphotria hydatis]